MRNRRGISGRVYSGCGDGMIVVDDEPWWGRMSMGIGVAIAVAVAVHVCNQFTPSTSLSLSDTQQNARHKAYEERLKNKVKGLPKDGNVGK